MLGALDYLAGEDIIHRDLKPDNILFSHSGGSYLFQLADFGLSNYFSLAKTVCGTGYYQAPEFWPNVSGVRARQSPKADIWSLFATIYAVSSRFKTFPPTTSDYCIVLDALKACAKSSPLEPMARPHPDHRASAAQLLVLFFDGRGLTTPRSKIPPIGPNAEADRQLSQPPWLEVLLASPAERTTLIDPGAELIPKASPCPAVRPSNRPQTRNNYGDDFKQLLNAYQLPKRALRQRASKSPFTPLLPSSTPRRGGNLAQPAASQIQPIRTHMDGVGSRDRPLEQRLVGKKPLKKEKSPEKKNKLKEKTKPKEENKWADKENVAEEKPPVKEPLEMSYHVPGMFIDD
jgi:serine/threonine protein kinase